MTNDLYINGKKVDSFGDWSPQTEHPAIAIQRKEHDERIALEQELKMSPKEITFVAPEPQEMPDICKSEALLELEKKYFPALKAQRLRLDQLLNRQNLRFRMNCHRSRMFTSHTKTMMVLVLFLRISQT